MNTIAILQDYMGEELTGACIARLMQGPEEHIGELLQRLYPCYIDWLESEELKVAKAAPTADTDRSDGQEREEATYYCIDPLHYHRPWREKLGAYKKYLLYFPRFAVPDPVAEFLWPHLAAASMFGSVNITDEFKENFRDALLLLAELAPGALKSDIILMPHTYAADYEVVQQAATAELETLKQKREYWEPLYSIAAQCAIDREGTHLVVDSFKIDAQLCARLDLTPVAGQELIHAVLKQDYERGIDHLTTANKTHRVAKTLLRYDVPGVENASFERVIALRQNEDAFYEWRREFGRVLDAAQKERPADDEQFEKEFHEAADARLASRIKELEKTTASSVLEKFLVPAALTLGAGAAAFYVAGLEAFPPTAAATAALGGPAGWVLDKVTKRFNKGGRRAVILREFYGYLLAKEK